MSSFAPLWPLSSVLQRQYGCPSSSAEVGRLTDSKTSLAERTAVATAGFFGDFHFVASHSSCSARFSKLMVVKES